MSNNFTYEKPDEKRYHQTLLAYLKKTGEDVLYRLLKGARCSVSETSTFSGKRWNAYYTKIIFQVSLDDFENFDSSILGRLTDICDLIMPKEVGFDVRNVEITPMISSGEDAQNLEADLEQIASSLRQMPTPFSLPEELLEKGEEMARVYLYLYAVENSLRLFVERVASDRHGSDYFEKLTVSSDVKRGIEARKSQEIKNQWLSLRGHSPLFYLDFKDLGTLILNNWELFKGYFPQQSWIATKLDELANCRNLVAHNSFVGNHERDVIRVNFNSIIRQINLAIK